MSKTIIEKNMGGSLTVRNTEKVRSSESRSEHPRTIARTSPADHVILLPPSSLRIHLCGLFGESDFEGQSPAIIITGITYHDHHTCNGRDHHTCHGIDHRTCPGHDHRSCPDI